MLLNALIEVAFDFNEHFALTYSVEKSHHHVETMPVIKLFVAEIVVPFTSRLAVAMVGLRLGFADPGERSFRRQEYRTEDKEYFCFHRSKSFISSRAIPSRRELI